MRRRRAIRRGDVCVLSRTFVSATHPLCAPRRTQTMRSRHKVESARTNIDGEPTCDSLCRHGRSRDPTRTGTRRGTSALTRTSGRPAQSSATCAPGRRGALALCPHERTAGGRAQPNAGAGRHGGPVLTGRSGQPARSAATCAPGRRGALVFVHTCGQRTAGLSQVRASPSWHACSHREKQKAGG